ncbi:MAG: CDP-alcohol phosphatidyltransferase family protein [Betaproteobacteria bacterium]|nr:CDP-alcohol phosphatidyltransferase family protein [Betaproteobacteria bacterium]
MNPGLGEIIASYRPRFRNELRTEWAAALIYRPLSFPLTLVFLALRWSPTQVTLLGLACALALPWLAWRGGEDALLLVGLLGVLFCVLDCVDGNLARVTGRSSRLGGYADFAGDLAFRVCLYAAIGLLADAASAGAPNPGLPIPGLAIGLLAAWLSLAARAGRLHLQTQQPRPTPEQTPPSAAPLTWVERIAGFLSGMDFLSPILLIVFGLQGGLPELLIYLLSLSLLDLVHTQVSIRNALIRKV